MQHPQYLYYAAIIAMATVEGVLRMRGRDAFGRLIWVLVAVFSASYAAYLLGARMPLAQAYFHAAGFVAGMAVSRHLPGHLAAAIFLPMVSIDLARVIGIMGEVSWWWAIYYLALAQLLTLSAGADLHPLGRWVRAWAARASNRFEFRALMDWGAALWT